MATKVKRPDGSIKKSDEKKFMETLAQAEALGLLRMRGRTITVTDEGRTAAIRALELGPQGTRWNDADWKDSKIPPAVAGLLRGLYWAAHCKHCGSALDDTGRCSGGFQCASPAAVQMARKALAAEGWRVTEAEGQDALGYTLLAERDGETIYVLVKEA